MPRLADGKMLISRGLTRRELMKTAGAIGLASAGSSLLFKPAVGRDAPLILTWPGWDEPELYPGFVEKYGVAPEFGFFEEIDEAFSKVVAGYVVDVMTLTPGDVQKWHDAGLLMPIDTSRLQYWPEVLEPLRALEGSRIDGQQYHVPGAYSHGFILYRTDVVEIDGEASWAMLWDERYRGRISTNDSVESTVVLAGLLIGADDAFDMTDAELDEARKLLRKQREVVRFYWTDPTQLEQAMAAGEVVIAFAWSESYQRLRDQGVPVAIADPKEGKIAYVDGFSMLKNHEAAEEMLYDFIDAWISPSASKFLIEEFGIVGSNQSAYESTDQSRLERLGLANILEDMKTSVYRRAIPPEKQTRYATMLAEVKAGG